MQKENINKNRFLFNVAFIFRREYEKYEGVPGINIYLLRLLFAFSSPPHLPHK